MTREEQAKKANPLALSNFENKCWQRGDEIYNYRGHYSEGFEDGAEWADANNDYLDFIKSNNLLNQFELWKKNGK